MRNKLFVEHIIDQLDSTIAAVQADGCSLKATLIVNLINH